MYLAYYDESGDDGYPVSSSDFFILSALYLDVAVWKRTQAEIAQFRRGLHKSHRLPIRAEMHTSPFLHNKGKFSGIGLTDKERVDIVGEFCALIGRLNVSLINVVIVKPRIKRPDYQVLDKALTYSVQRVSNDMTARESDVMIISDPGRVGKMRKTVRRLQRINYISSKFGGTYRQEIECLVEDVVTKESEASSFIQLCDVVTFVMHLYAIDTTGYGRYAKRLPSLITPVTVATWLDLMKPSINLKACPAEPYGVFFHPK